MGKENQSENFTNNPEISAIINPFIERRQKINGLIFLPEDTFISRLPELNKTSQKYLSSLNSFRTLAGETYFQVLDRVYDYLCFYQYKLPLDEKISYQEARRFLHSLYPENFGRWAAIRAFGYQYLSKIFEGEEFFKNPNIFDIKLEFYEHGVKPVDFKNGQEENFYLHLPIEENGKKFFGCWSPGETRILHYHKAEENCLQGVAFKR